jgi:hypothetical protein
MMSSSKEKRLKRLVEVRKRQRDEVGVAVRKARTTRDEQDAKYRESVDAVNEELRSAQIKLLEALNPDQRRLQIECLIASQADAAMEEQALKKAEAHLLSETTRLSRAHSKMRQVEILAQAQRKADLDKADKAEQKESDDLSATKESSQ